MSGEMIAIITAASALAAVLVPGQRAIRRDIQQLSARVGRLEARMAAWDKRFDAWEKYFDAWDKRFDAIEKRQIRKRPAN